MVWSTDEGAAHRARGGRRTGPSSATSSRPWRPTAGGAGPATLPLGRRRAHHRHRLGPHDGRGRAGPRRRACATSSGPTRVAIGSINSPMQCMMKEICSPVPAAPRRPGDGQGVSFVFSCFNQDQALDQVDFGFLAGGSGRTPRPRSSRRCGSITCSSSARSRPSRRIPMCYHVYMKRARRRLGVREMRQNLSVYLRRALSGETFEVTARGRPVAVLGPVVSGRTPMDLLVASGRASPPEGDLLELGPAPGRGRSGRLSQALQEQRAERF